LDVSTDTASSYATRIFNDGNNTDRYGLLVQAGEDTPSGTSTAVTLADGDGGTVGSITFDGTQTYYNTSSDRRLKANIRDTEIGIDMLMDIEVRDFEFKADPQERTVHGMIAQDLYEIYPQAVQPPRDENDIWMVDYSKLTPLLIQSVQDQYADMEGLRTDVEELATMQSDIERISEENKVITEFFLAMNPETLLYTDTDGNLDLLGGKLKASGVVAGAFTVAVDDEEARTIGEATILAIDQAEDAEESSIFVPTTAVTESSRVFVTPKSAHDEAVYVSEVLSDEGFSVSVKGKIEEDVAFDWVIIEEEVQ